MLDPAHLTLHLPHDSSPGTLCKYRVRTARFDTRWAQAVFLFAEAYAISGCRQRDASLTVVARTCPQLSILNVALTKIGGNRRTLNPQLTQGRV
jgi:hypothetical protein